jgi:diguanylate cyclase (GGDEF)-like protein
MEAGSRDSAFTRAELERLALFAAADLDTLEPVLLGCPVRALAPHEVLVALGAENRQLYLVLSGELGIHLESPDAPALTRLGPGETIGEISLIDRKPASAYVIAAVPARVLVLDEELLWILADSSHAVAFNLLRTLAARLRAGNQIIQRDREQLELYKFHASVDALTGLFNRFWMDKMLLRQMERSRVSGDPLSLLLIDVDLFKQLNDRHGHVAGDCALRAVAACMRTAVRPTDLLARYGGEEFTVLLPGAALANARDVAERLRAAVSAAPIVYVDGSPLPSVTVSIGAAQMGDAATPAALLELADRALYRAKNAGRNRVEG